MPYLITVVISAFAPATEVRAAFMSNGSFNSGADGLLRWNVSDANYVQATSGTAQLLESPFAAEVTLSQVFTFESTATSLSFRICALTNCSNPDDAFIPDAFGVSLLDPNDINVSLTNTVPNNTDSYYIRDLFQGVTTGVSASGVTVADVGAASTSSASGWRACVTETPCCASV